MTFFGFVLTIFVVVLSQVTARTTDYCYAQDHDPYVLMGTKTAYQFAQEKTRLLTTPPGCTPAQIWVLTRHGTRYPGRKSVAQLNTLPKLRDQILYNHNTRGNGRMCNDDLQNLSDWYINPNVTDSMADYLTTQGKADMRLFALRLRSAFSNLFRLDPQFINAQNYKFRSTATQRTEASMDTFMQGLFNRKGAVQPEVPPSNDTLLHMYKNCPAWQKSLTTDHVDYEAEQFINGPEYQNLIQNVSKRLGFGYNINNDSIQLMYDMCRYEKAWNVERNPAWCAVFSREEMKILEYLEDLDVYYYSGPGREINEKMGCPLLKDMFTHFRNLERRGFESEPKGIFYFAHTVTVQNLMAALGIGKDSVPVQANNYYSMAHRNFRTSKLASFAANLVAVFYRCSDAHSPNKVIFYMNEKYVDLDGCRVGLCDWEYLKEKFGRAVDECDPDFCFNSGSPWPRGDWVITTLFALMAIGRPIFHSINAL